MAALVISVKVSCRRRLLLLAGPPITPGPAAVTHFLTHGVRPLSPPAPPTIAFVHRRRR